MRSTETTKTRRTLSAIVVGEGTRRAAGRAREVQVETIKRTKVERRPAPTVERKAAPPIIVATPLPVEIETIPAVAITTPPVAPPAPRPARQPIVVTTAAPQPSRRHKLRSASLREVGLRIDQRRKELGISMQALGDMLIVPRTKGAVAHWITGITGMTIAQANDVSRILDVDPIWLAFGRSSTVPLSGEIHLGGIVTEPRDATELVTIPPGLPVQLEIAAYRVLSGDLAPMRVGDLVYTAKRATVDLQATIGQDAIVQLANGQRVLRTVDISPEAGCISLTASAGRILRDIVPLNVWIVLAIVRASAVEYHRRQLEREAEPSPG